MRECIGTPEVQKRPGIDLRPFVGTSSGNSDTSTSLFSSPEWCHLLQSAFNAHCMYAVDREGGATGLITIFPVGPFRIAYLGFPTGGLVNGSQPDQDYIDSLRASIKGRANALRVPVSGFDRGPDLNERYYETPETAIIDLPQWKHEQLPSALRRNLRRAERGMVQIRTMTRAGDAAFVFKIYKETVSSHGGNIRYSKRYFERLQELTETEGKLIWYLAEVNNILAGFLIIADHNETAVYLHGGSAQPFRPLRVSDILFYRAIKDARDRGKKEFNMMSSPVKQAGLTQYKQKWGGLTRYHRLFELPVGKGSYKVLCLAEAVYRQMTALRQFIKGC